MKRLLLILLSINLFTLAFGQSLTVKGKVSSTDGELLPGVNVKVKDATIGTITDFDGNYQLQVNKYYLITTLKNYNCFLLVKFLNMYLVLKLNLLS